VPAAQRTPRRIAVLVSGSGTNLQALLDASAGDPFFGGTVVVVASDQPECLGLKRAAAAGIPTVAARVADHADRDSWEAALTDAIWEHRPDLVVLAGFMRVLSPLFLKKWPDRVINIHPSLLPAFPGPLGVREAIAYGVKVTGTTVHFVDEQVDHGPIIAQRPVEVSDHDDETSLHDRIKVLEHMLLPAVVKLLCHDRIVVEGRRTRRLPAADSTAFTALDRAEGLPSRAAAQGDLA
jgi:phosphoribosylglycinamide formyltransferase 1